MNSLWEVITNDQSLCYTQSNSTQINIISNIYECRFYISLVNLSEAFIEPMHGQKPIITYLFTYLTCQKPQTEPMISSGKLLCEILCCTGASSV